jgi:hypothetical protein
MKKIISIVIVAILLGGGGTFLWLYYGGFENEKNISMEFVEIYGDYLENVNKVEYFVHLPGTENNSDRSELLRLLNSILTEKLEPKRREELARIAFTNLDVLKKEVDSAQIYQANLYKVIQEMGNVSVKFSAVDLRNKAENIVMLARERAELSSRITSVLSETNEQTYAIITRILEEKGKLTDEHIIAINNATDMAEERFHSLEVLYEKLLDKKNEMDKSFDEFVKTAI